MRNWQRRFNRGVPPASERARWAEGDTGVGVITGPASHGVVAIDIDTDDPSIMAAIMASLPATSIKKRGAKGETLFYYGPHIETSISWNVEGCRVVDLIGPGRQTVLPPTIHPDTSKPYVWTGSETLEDVEPRELPGLTTDIVSKILRRWRPLVIRRRSHVSAASAAMETRARIVN